jgi:hypothetical protein
MKCSHTLDYYSWEKYPLTGAYAGFVNRGGSGLSRGKTLRAPMARATLGGSEIFENMHINNAF